MGSGKIYLLLEWKQKPILKGEGGALAVHLKNISSAQFCSPCREIAAAPIISIKVRRVRLQTLPEDQN
jgi:hypothetical protein